jgi:tetratricopeptide (TPR) repeat protein
VTEHNETNKPPSSVDAHLHAVKAKRNRQLFAGFAVLGLAMVIMALIFWLPSQPMSATAEPPQQLLKAEPLSDTMKQQLQERLVASQTNLASWQTNTGFVKWAGEQFTQLERRLELSFNDYRQGDFAALTDNLDFIELNLAKLESQYIAALSEWLSQAEQAFSNKQYVKAEGLLKKALALNPNFDEASALLLRIQAAPEVTKHLEQYHEALATGDASVQLAALNAVLAVDPEHEFANQHRSELEQRVVRENTQALLSQLHLAIEQSQIVQADALFNQLQTAGTLSAKYQSQLSTLGNKLTRLKQSMQQDALEETLSALIKQDSWADVMGLVKLAVVRFPHHPFFQTVNTQSADIVRLQNKLNSYLNRPERLSDSNIRHHAEKTLQQAQAWFVSSPSLRQQAEQLENTLSAKQAKIRVIVHSDKRTSLRILGVGELGEFAQKEVELPPGRYRFEARRTGYKSEILDVDVQQTIMPIEISLMCKEKV